MGTGILERDGKGAAALRVRDLEMEVRGEASPHMAAAGDLLSL